MNPLLWGMQTALNFQNQTYLRKKYDGAIAKHTFFNLNCDVKLAESTTKPSKTCGFCKRKTIEKDTKCCFGLTRPKNGL